VADAIRELRALMEKATKGPLTLGHIEGGTLSLGGQHNRYVCEAIGENARNDLLALAAAFNALEPLLAVVEKAEALRSAMRQTSYAPDECDYVVSNKAVDQFQEAWDRLDAQRAIAHKDGGGDRG
jgi:hypothetical protein